MAKAIEPYSGQIVTRAEASAAGAKKFYTGESCSQGHISQRYMRNGACVPCQRAAHNAWKAANPGAAEAANVAWKLTNPGAAEAATLRWQKANPDKVRGYDAKRDPAHRSALAKARRKQNPEKMRLAPTKWIKANPEKRRGYQAKWRAKYPEKVQAHATKRRTLKAQSVGSHTAGEVVGLFVHQAGKCAYCQTTLMQAINLPNSATVDHIISLRKGGTNWIENIALCCKPCNSSKGVLDPVVFARRMGIDIDHLIARALAGPTAQSELLL